MREKFTAVAPVPVLGMFDEQVRQNMALFDRAMKMFTPFSYRNEDATPEKSTASSAAPEESLSEIKRQMAAMQEQIAALSQK